MYGFPIFSKQVKPTKNNTFLAKKNVTKSCYEFFVSSDFPLQTIKRHTPQMAWGTRKSWEDTNGGSFSLMARVWWLQSSHLFVPFVQEWGIFVLYPSLLPCCPGFFEWRLKSKTKKHLINPIRPHLQKVLARKEQSPRNPEREQFRTMSSNVSWYFISPFYRVIFAIGFFHIVQIQRKKQTTTGGW